MGHVCEAGKPHCFTAVSHFDAWITKNSGVVPSASNSNSTDSSTTPNPGSSTAPNPNSSTTEANANSDAGEKKMKRILDLVKDLLARKSLLIIQWTAIIVTAVRERTVIFRLKFFKEGQM